MNQRNWIASGIIALLLTASPALASKSFKGTQPSPDLTAGVVTGLGILGYGAGLPFHLTLSKRFAPAGFIEDINNSGHIEIEAGPSLGSFTSIYFAAHLRWDFVKDDLLTFYGTGGVASNVLLSTLWFSPRFSVGLFYRLAKTVALRAQVSHDLVGGGVIFFLN